MKLGKEAANYVS